MSGLGQQCQPTRIRTANVFTDTEGILDIYAPAVRDTRISLELEPPTLEEMRNRISSGLEKFPWIVCEHSGEILGYAHGCPYKSRLGYQWTAEVGLYVAPSSHRRGIGTKLLDVLFDILTHQGYYTVVNGITLPNDPSIQLHLRNGFEQVGIFKNVGFKLGEWCDVVSYQKELRPCQNSEPGPPTPFSQLDYKFGV